MNGPFTKVPAIGLPQWTVDPTSPGNFMPIQFGGGTSIPEVGYGEGGYGEGGYDAPSVNIPASGSTNWTVETQK